MKGVPISPRRVYGVALEVGDEAGLHTWLCRATPGSEGIRVESVDRLAELPGGAAPRDDALRYLLGKVLEAPRSAWGIDAPFGTPADAGDAEPAAHEPAPWRERWLAGLAQEAHAPAARRTERESGLTVQSPERHRLVAAHLLRPLAGRGEVAILPFDPLPVLPAGTPPAMAARAPSIYLLECRPEATVVALARCLDEALSEAMRDTPAGRAELLRALVRARWVRPMARRLRVRIAEADTPRAIDSVLVAVATWRGYREADHGALCRDPHYGVEGLVYC